MTRSIDEMRRVCAELSARLGKEVEHENLGVILVVYELDGVDSDEDSPVAFAGTVNKDIPVVLATLLEQHFIPKEEKH